MTKRTYARVENIIAAMGQTIPLPEIFENARGEWIVDDVKGYALYLLSRLNQMLNEMNYRNIESLIAEIERLFSEGRAEAAKRQEPANNF